MTTVVVLSIYMVSTRSKVAATNSLAVLSKDLIKEKIPVSVEVEFYPESKTRNVRQKLDDLLINLNKRNDFNGALLVAKNGKVLYENRVGIADFNKNEELNEHSLFQLASVSKQFTAAAIMMLYEQNKIELTDNVTRFFPNFPYDHVTIKNLLNHTAGLPKYFYVAEKYWTNKTIPSNEEVLELLCKTNVQRNFKAGNAFEYSNTGYMVLASIVEKVSGKNFGDYLAENIFEPLGMKDTFVYSHEHDSIKANQLDGYRLHRGWKHSKIQATVHDAVVGDKNIYATTEDLFKWILGLNNGKLLSKESVELMYSKGETASGRKIPYGFGFRIDPKDENVIYHNGKWNGFSTSLVQYTKDDLVIIVLEHTSYTGITALNKKIRQIVADNFRA